MVIPHLMFSTDRLIAYFRELPFIIITITRSKSARDPNRVNCMWQHTHRSAIKKQSKSCLGRGSFNFSFYWQISRYFCIIQEYKFPILPTLFFFFHNIHCVALNSSHEQLHEWPRRDDVFYIWSRTWLQRSNDDVIINASNEPRVWSRSCPNTIKAQSQSFNNNILLLIISCIIISIKL